MRKATLWMLVLAFALCVSCEKALLEPEEPTPATKTDTGKSDSGGSDNDDSDTGDDNDGDNTGGSGGNTGGSGGDTGTGGSGNSESTDSITYPDNGTSGTEEKDIVDGNDDKDKDEPSTSGLMVGNEKAYSVTEFLSNSYRKAVWVVGYVVGDCYKKIANADFDPPFSHPQALLLADDPNETDVDKVIAIQLATNRQEEFSLQSHPENHRKKRLAVFGTQATYLGITGMKNGGKDADYIGSMTWYDK